MRQMRRHFDIIFHRLNDSTIAITSDNQYKQFIHLQQVLAQVSQPQKVDRGQILTFE